MLVLQMVVRFAMSQGWLLWYHLLKKVVIPYLGGYTAAVVTLAMPCGEAGTVTQSCYLHL